MINENIDTKSSEDARQNAAPSNQLIGENLQGTKTSKIWSVKAKQTKSNDATGGSFSIGYIVTDESGKEFFLKATDQSLAILGYDNDRLRRLTKAISAQQFERDILDICSNASLNRIVRAIDYGEKSIVCNGVGEIVFFIVFEKAEGDIRAITRELRNSGYDWIPQYVHGLTTAVSQLHNIDITHNDIKPSNLLIFDRVQQKLADLGRATSNRLSGPFDNSKAVGDKTYLAPEEWGYDYTPPLSGNKISISYRKNCELYMLGGLIFYFLTGASLNHIISESMSREFIPTELNCKFHEILPYIENAHVKAMNLMNDEIIHKFNKNVTKDLDEIIFAVNYLTKPDPGKRGDPMNSKRGLQQCDLQRLISISDRIAKKMELLK